MTPRVHLTTPRLLLRAWSDDDAEAFAAINSDPRVMEFFPALLDRAQSDALMARIRREMDERGYGAYAVEERATGKLIGFTGLSVPAFDAPFMPAVEIGWRLAREAWGQGYATEAASAARDHGFQNLGLDEIVSFTTEWNRPSQRVMKKIGMTRDAEADFIHPKVPPGHKLARHVLYRISRADWLNRPAED